MEYPVDQYFSCLCCPTFEHAIFSLFSFFECPHQWPAFSADVIHYSSRLSRARSETEESVIVLEIWKLHIIVVLVRFLTKTLHPSLRRRALQIDVWIVVLVPV